MHAICPEKLQQYTAFEICFKIKFKKKTMKNLRSKLFVNQVIFLNSIQMFKSSQIRATSEDCREGLPCLRKSLIRHRRENRINKKKHENMQYLKSKICIYRKCLCNMQTQGSDNRLHFCFLFKTSLREILDEEILEL